MRDVLDAVPEAISGSFFDLLAEWQAAKSIGTDDLIPAVLPLFEQVRRQHEQGNVAPLDGVDRLQLHDGRELWFNAADGQPDRADADALARIDQPQSEGIDVTGEIDVYEAGDLTHVGNRRIAERGKAPDQPLYYLDYTTWEMAAGHHDALADIFALGMILGSLATRLDFTKRGDLQKFLACRRNVHAVNPRIHPVVSRLIAHMTELKREDRAQDLGASSRPSTTIAARRRTTSRTGWRSSKTSPIRPSGAEKRRNTCAIACLRSQGATASSISRRRQARPISPSARCHSCSITARSRRTSCSSRPRNSARPSIGTSRQTMPATGCR